jgi:hypothetical protein
MLFTRYGMDGSEFKSQSEEIFSSPSTSIPALGSTHRRIQWLPGLFPGGKAH